MFTLLAYGLSVAALAATPAPPGPVARTREWHPLDLRRVLRDPQPSAERRIGPDHATLPVPGRLVLEVGRNPLRAVVASPRPVPDEVVAHPLLSWVGAVAAAWGGRTALHGTAVVLHDRAWVLLGRPGSGKTTLGALLQADGVPVLADDLSVIDDGVVLAGPRAGDLRQDAAAHLGLGSELGELIGRPRWRLPLAPTPLEVPLGGFVELGWADDLVTGPVPPADRLALLARHDALLLGPGGPRGWLDLLAVPTWRLDRPADWRAADATVRAVRGIAQAGR